MDAAFDDQGVLHCGTVQVGDVLKLAGGKQDRAERVADVVADDRQNPLLEVLCEGELFLIVLLLRFVRPASLVNVDTAANIARKASRIICERNAAIEDPAVDAVVPAKPVLHFERLAPVEVIEIVPDAAVKVVRVHTLRPAVAHFLFDRPPRVRQPRIVEVVAAGVNTRTPNHDWRMPDQETILAGRQSSAHR
jgi:hypothetical protein